MSEGDDAGEQCWGDFCVALVDACWPSSKRGQCIACILVLVVILVVIICVLVAAYAVVTPVSAGVKSASVFRLRQAAGANNATNDTSSSSYGISLLVAVRNPNFAMKAVHAAPLDADLRIAGHRFDNSSIGGGVVRLADAGDKLKPKETAEYQVNTAGEMRAEEFGSGLPVEVALAGEVKYLPFHGRGRALSAFCRMKLQMPLHSGVVQAAPVFRPLKCVGS